MKAERCGYILVKITLNKLLKCIGVACQTTIEVQGITDRSDEAKQDWLFISLHGTRDSGEKYLDEVLAKGAYVLSSEPHDDERIWGHEHLHKAAAELLDVYYARAYEKLHVCGVTGTSGKTSVSSLCVQLLNAQGLKTMLIGTNGIQYEQQMIPTGNTTPSLFILMRCLHEALERGITHVVMEVSSHAVATHRIGNIRYDVIIFTRITSDHLDFHFTQSQYRYTKFKLRFSLKPQGTVILHNDDQKMREFYQLNHHKLITYGFQAAHFTAESPVVTDRDSSFVMHDYTFHSPLLSDVNILNTAAVIAYGRLIQVSYAKLQETVSRFQGIPGRLECIRTQAYTIWIDYAHTSDALKNVLLFAEKVKTNRVITVIGCGGERDRIKRPLMAELSAHYSDLTILTADNPRSEWLPQILFDMCPEPKPNTVIIEDRRCAIKHAVKNAGNGDIIIIAGRGNEAYQTIYGQRIPFLDQDAVKEILLREEVPWISNI